jgi:uncharacterized protein (UPF0147 family)
LCPQLQPDAKVIIPVSMARYQNQKEKFDFELSTLFSHMADKLKQNEIQSVDVLSTTALHEEWPKNKIEAIENHFFNTHAKILRKQINFFSWDDWIKQQGEKIYQKYYEEVVELSKEGSEWYDLMLKTHHNVSTINTNVEASLRYQRREYAAIRTMNHYTDLVYMGHISSAWSHLYRIYPDIPRFVRASIHAQVSQIKNYDADMAVKMATTLIEQIVSSPNFPSKKKEKLQEICHNLFRTYLSTISLPNHPIDSRGVPLNTKPKVQMMIQKN